MKRTLDIVLVCLLALPAMVICSAVALIILVTERKSAFFFQQRLGKDEKLFKIIKLRTMKPNTVHAGTHEISSHAVTATGRWARKTKVDELPQLWNVLAGQMSFVGPRPSLPTQVDLIEARRKQNVYQALPGITGLAQINDIDMSTPIELAECDSTYIRNRTLLMDLDILLRTVLGSGLSDKVGRSAGKYVKK